jgi:hypothetical protein
LPGSATLNELEAVVVPFFVLAAGNGIELSSHLRFLRSSRHPAEIRLQEAILLFERNRALIPAANIRNFRL